MREVVCRACGAIIEGDDDESVIEMARAHAQAAHGYDLSPAHVLVDIRDSEDGVKKR